MKKLTHLLILLSAFNAYSQSYAYEPNEEFPYGRLNPDAPEQVGDFQGLIGDCNCKSVSRISQSEWADTVNMRWTFKYIMNGTAVQDMTLKEDGIHSGSIRQYNADSLRWYVHYYSSSVATPTLSAWEGNKIDDGTIVLRRDQVAPNGMAGKYRLTFSNISEEGYDWAGEWVDTSETIIYPTWRIFCKRTD